MIIDDWTATVTGLSAPLTRSGIDTWQWHRLRETLAFARASSPFYRARAGWPANLPDTLEEFRRLPFTTEADLRAGTPPLVALSQAEIARVVTLPTSGTTGEPKRLHFTASEVEDIISFFAAGMGVFTRAGDTVVIAFPGERPGSIGDLLKAAMTRLGARAVLVPWTMPPAELGRLIAMERADVVAGPPVRLLAAARSVDGTGWALPRVRAVLASSDHLPGSIRTALAQAWGVEVFDHWGMTETGLGGAVECTCHNGMHLRETELFAEIVDPETGTALPEGATGELVLTTLRRRGLPLIRYRTGDLASLTRAPCRCGSPLARLRKLEGRIGTGLPLSGGTLTMALLDEVLFSVEGVTDFSATVTKNNDAAPTLHIVLGAPPHWQRPALQVHCRGALREAVPLGAALATGALTLEMSEAGTPLLDHGGKRRLVIR